MDFSTDTNRPLAHYWHHCILCVFLILLGIFGCGGDEMEDLSGDEDEVDTYSDEVNPLAIFFGTWTLITADDKTYKADLQQLVGNERKEVPHSGVNGHLCFRWFHGSGNIVYGTVVD